MGGNASKNRITRATKVKSEHHKESGRGIIQSSSLERCERATCQATGDPNLRTKIQRIASDLAESHSSTPQEGKARFDPETTIIIISNRHWARR